MGTLTRFFSLHFLLPFVVAGLRIVHLLFLHQTGRNNPLGINRNFDKVFFPSLFFDERCIWICCFINNFRIYLLFLSLNIRRSSKFYSCKSFGYTCAHSTRVIFFNSLRYFTIYSNKLGGVVALALSIVILIICPFI